MDPKSTCPGCKASFTQEKELPLHKYGVMAPECWAAFNTLLGYEADNFGYPEEHRLTVDAYGVQHPQNLELQKQLGIKERLIQASVQSVGRHLIGLYCALEKKMDLLSISKVMGQVIKSGQELELLEPQESMGDITIANFSPDFSREEYSQFAWAWAQSAWNAWAHKHDLVRSWMEKYAPHAV